MTLLSSSYADQFLCITYCREEYVEEICSAHLQNPPTIKYKGHPRSQHLTGVLEGCARGGGGSLLCPHQAGMKDCLCGVCRTSAHKSYRPFCNSYCFNNSDFGLAKLGFTNRIIPTQKLMLEHGHIRKLERS